jgi:NAD(P)-dependent dehydrogenase (short-subunit alcohol dehydrogenase family)
LRYAAEGAGVVLGDIDMSGANAVVDEIKKQGGRAIATRLDGGDEATIAASVALAVSTYGGLDGLHVNYASFADEGRKDEDVLDLPMEAFDKTMHVDVRGYFLCTRHALPEIVKRGSGCILYAGSGGAYMGEPTRVAYAMSKIACHALMRHVATKFGAKGVRANCVSPGITMHAKWEHLGDEFKTWAASLGPLKTRLGRPEDLAAMSALLMSDEGAFVTGQVICVDGGITMRA